jgi:hypothetical protein
MTQNGLPLGAQVTNWALGSRQQRTKPNMIECSNSPVAR